MNITGGIQRARRRGVWGIFPPRRPSCDLRSTLEWYETPELKKGTEAYLVTYDN